MNSGYQSEDGGSCWSNRVHEQDRLMNKINIEHAFIVSSCIVLTASVKDLYGGLKLAVAVVCVSGHLPQIPGLSVLRLVAWLQERGP